MIERDQRQIISDGPDVTQIYISSPTRSQSGIAEYMVLVRFK